MSCRKRPRSTRNSRTTSTSWVDRIVVRPRPRPAPRGKLETALKLAEGLAVIEYADAPAAPASDDKKKTAKIHDKSGPERILFSEKFACPVSGFTIPEIEPRLFSSTTPMARARPAAGLGVEQISTRISSFPTRS